MSHPHPELPPPGPLPENGLRITALGGLGEVGRNMTVFEYDGRLLIVDCGVLFPEEHHPGVDLILPDFESIRDRLDQVEALVLTHGHEDHIGATPYLLRERPDIPLVGSKLTLALLRSKLQEHRLKETAQHVVTEGDRISFGPFDLEFVAVNHSIPDALAVAIRTGAGLVLHTGDFKMDQLPLDGRITDLRAFARLGEEGVDLFMVDSTNSEVPGFTTNERDIAPVLDRVFTNARHQRIIVACFASISARVRPEPIRGMSGLSLSRYGTAPMWSSWPCVSTTPTTSSSLFLIGSKSGRIRSTPGWCSSGNSTPQSTIRSLPPYSKTVMLRPTSPRPPSGVTRRVPASRAGGS